MSDTDTPIMPSPDVVYASGNALMLFRHAFTTLQVFPMRNDGRRIEVNDDGRRVVFDLDAAQARHLSELLLRPLPAPPPGSNDRL